MVRSHRQHGHRGRKIGNCDVCGDPIFALQQSDVVSATPLRLAHVRCRGDLDPDIAPDPDPS